MTKLVQVNKRIGIHIVLLLYLCCSLQHIQAVNLNEFKKTILAIDTLQVDTSNIQPRRFDNLREKYSNDDFIYESTIENSGWWSRFKQ